MKSLASCGPRIRFEWTAPFGRRSALRREQTSLAPIRGAHALYRRPRECPGYLARVDHRRRIAAGGWKTYVGFITTQPPIVRRESAGKTSRWMVCICTGGHVMAIAPTLQRYLAAEN